MTPANILFFDVLVWRKFKSSALAMELCFFCNKTLSTPFTSMQIAPTIARFTNVKDVFPMCYSDIRSMSKTFSSFKNNLNSSLGIIQYNVTIVGMPKTWLNDTIYDLHGLQGYHFIEQHRSYLGGRDSLCA